MEKIKYTDALAYGFKEYFKNFKLFLKISFRYFLISAIAAVICFGLMAIKTFNNPLLSFSIFTVLPYLAYTLIEILLWELMSAEILVHGFNLYNNNDIKAYNLSSSTLKDYITARFIYYVRFAIGFFLFIIPGIYIFAKYFFTGFTIIEKGNLIKEDREYNILLSKNRLINFLFWGMITSLLTMPFMIFSWFILPPIALASVHAFKQISKD